MRENEQLPCSMSVEDSPFSIFIENAIAGIKRYNILVHCFRNNKDNFEDDVIGICARLWNLTLSY